ncbi:MAG: DUF3822 family protein [Amoebophilaceae bacterium]|nr:DUF3822 family protein [Amoebophilaceae bacterium]
MEDILSEENYQCLLAVRDKTLNITTLPECHLSIHISGTCFKVSCVNLVTTQCMLLEVYRLAYGHAYQRVRSIEQLYQDHPLLVANNWSAVTLCIDNQQYTLIPQQLFQEKNGADYLGLACPISTNEIRHFTHVSLNVTVAFAMDPCLINWFQATYHQARLYTIHQANALIKSTHTYLQRIRASTLPIVLVFVEERYLYITVMGKSMLYYYNRFQYTHSDEWLRYILIVMHTLKLDTSLHTVILGGKVTKSAPAYKKARNYIRKLTLMGRPPYLKSRSIFSKEMMGSHLDVLSTYLCHQNL